MCVAAAWAPGPGDARGTTIWEARAPEDTSGQPWKDTTAEAMTKSPAATASSDPAVPNPARYARGVRIRDMYRRVGEIALASAGRTWP